MSLTADSVAYSSEGGEEWLLDSSSPHTQVFVPATYAAVPALCRRLATSLHWKRALCHFNVAALTTQVASLVSSFFPCPVKYILWTWIVVTTWIFLQLLYWTLLDLVRNHIGLIRTCEAVLLRLEFWVAVFAINESAQLIQRWPESHVQYTIVSVQLIIVLLNFCKLSHLDLQEANQLLNSRVLDCKEALIRDSDIWRDDNQSYPTPCRGDLPYYSFEDAHL
eukprot:Gregarina_sp_Pseudo_9__5648@NODE_791_length_2214_cov_171_588506_g745_i0_p2_GENE_NODE_791_length_2214_cov_171_588506_g745_i0NODE_791_length_2214_cov_171_588506_g745_i0_p2_ORF_typecomplete_len222_score32_41_NODE_791_length_2214_cov_171_588506_g745_i038703